MSVEQAVARWRAVPERTLLLAMLVIVFGVLSTRLAGTQVLGRIPLQNLLKNGLGADRSTNAAFFFWTTMPWYLKPLVGIFTDAFPLFGSRRKSYMMIAAAASAAAWWALCVTAHRYGNLLAVCLLINIAMMVASTVVGAYLVEAAQASASAGRLTSVRNFVEQFSWVIAGPTGGLLGSIAFGWTAILCGSVAFLIVPVALFALREPVRPHTVIRPLADLREQLLRIARARSMWAAAGIAALFYFAPGVNTGLFYIQQNELHLGTQAQGYLVMLSGLCGITAAALYGAFASRRLTLRTLLVIALLMGTAANLGYLFYSSFPRAQFIEGFNGFGYTLAEVALMHLAVRATPAGSEALGFALIMAVRNLGLFGADWVGAYLLDQHYLGFHALVIANAATSCIAAPLVLLLPAALVDVRDGGRRVAP
jgi:predicted MFS family arabinose efflux permease